MADTNTSLGNGNPESLAIFSIGHSNQSIETFLALLRRHEIQVLVDVRSSPYSKYVPHFNSTKLAVTVEQIDIEYKFMGQELGGRPDGDEFYDADNHVLYKRVAESPFFLKGIQRLIDIGAASRTAIMCSEEDPAICHRHLLIGHVLTEQGVDLLHIRGDGHLQNEKDVNFHEENPFYAQSLWGDELSDQEEYTWRSIRSVSRRKQQPNFSDL
jgi:uncharacterized protein (DUF488 family)